LTANLNPMTGQTDARTWTDRDGNGSVLDAAGNVQFNELGPSTNLNLAIPGGAQKIADGLPRSTNWEESVSIQHELFPRISVTGGYYRRQFYNIQYTNNLALNPVKSYTPFTITVPANANLPNGGGQQITLYNLNQTVAANNITTWSTNNTRIYNGLEISVNARIPRGFIFGGVTTERTATNDCDGPYSTSSFSNPDNLRFCQKTPPFRALYKASAGVTVPLDIQVSGSVQAVPGGDVQANFTYNSAYAGITLTGANTRTVNLLAPNTLFLDYQTQVDARLSRAFRIGGKRLQGYMDIFNILNASTVVSVNQTYATTNNQWLKPLVVMQARRFQFGGRLDF